MLSAPFCCKQKQKYWCYYTHLSRDSVSPICEIFHARLSKTNRFSSLGPNQSKKIVKDKF